MESLSIESSELNSISINSPLSTLTFSPLKNFISNNNNNNKLIYDEESLSLIENNDNEHIYDEESLSLNNNNESISSSIQYNNNLNNNIYLPNDNPDLPNYYLCRIRYFTIFFTFLFILFYIIDNNVDDFSSDFNLYMGMISLYPECKDNRLQLWKFISNIFIHSNPNHFFSNLFFFILLSSILESFQDYYYIFFLYIIGIIHGDLAFYYTKPYSYALGSSHGVFAILGLNISNTLINYNFFYILTFIFSLTFFGFIIFSEAYSYNENNNIAYISHWTSLISGFLGGLSYLKKFKLNIVNKYISLFSSHIYILFSFILLYNYIYNYPPLQSYNNLLQPIPTFNCCYEWFKYKKENENSKFENFQCPYIVEYIDKSLYI